MTTKPLQARAAFWFGIGALLLAWLHLTRTELWHGSLPLFGHDFNLPVSGFGLYLALWIPFGSLAAAAFAAGWLRIFRRDPESRLEAWNELDDGRWMLYGALFGGLIPALIRTLLLHGAPLTDDESAYEFMGQALALGHLYADSPPFKVFFDNPLMINDGKLYAQYFVGWPAFLAVGTWLGIPGFMASICSGATVPALFLVLRRILGSPWARLGIVLYLTSPMLMTSAATATSHTACILALAWTLWLCLRSRDADASLAVHLGAALAFCVAFFIRPTSALGVGLPFLIYWLLGRVDREQRRRPLPWLAFIVPCLVLAGLFLGVNKAQTGDYLTVAYERAYTYAEENDFKFSVWEAVGGGISEIGFGDLGRGAAVQGAALLRLGFALLGWPCSLLLTLWAFGGSTTGRAATRLLGASVLCYLGIHLSINNVGIDTFAPMHYVELAWPLLLLTVIGAQALTDRLADLDRRLGAGSDLRLLPAAAVAGLVCVALLSYTPLRLATIERIADDVALPRQVLQESGIENAVVFVRGNWTRYCESAPDRGWVFHRPNNDPQLKNSVLWVNHLSLDENRRLMTELFPDRQGYFYVQDPETCRIAYVPLGELTPAMLNEGAS